MKKYLNRRTLWQSLLSMTVLSIFILVALGSLGYFMIRTTEILSDGRYRVTQAYNLSGDKMITVGNKDEYGRWHGEIVVGTPNFTEEVTMVHGRRHGTGSYRYHNSGIIKHREYIMGHCWWRYKKATYNNMADTSAFQVLYNKYPWFLFTLNGIGFDSTYVKSYMDTLVTVLSTNEFDEAEFDDYYDEVSNILAETPYDSIIELNSALAYYQGLDELTNAELRLAVIDRYRSEGNTTYNIVNTTYPGYLSSLNDLGVNDQDFEEFCHDLDDSLTSYEPLDPEDPFFVDSIDSRIFRALYAIVDIEDATSSFVKRSMKNTALVYANHDIRGIYNKVNSILKPLISKSSSSEVGMIVAYSMLVYYMQGDILRQSVREAWLNRKGIMRVPTVTTVFSGNNSATSATIQGFVIEDGGAAVTSRGIAWATFYNPTTDDNIVTRESGTGDFTVMLTGLTEGTTYYARTYATNSAGTAYGNCITFIATDAAGIGQNKIVLQDLTVYPNPVSASTTFSFHLESSENMMLSITDMKGQEVLHRELGTLPQGKYHVQLDLSGLQDGMYTCQLTSCTAKVTRKLVIAH
jgi:hypothetical protein